MKETGVTRRIDELGRIVIPKEIRKNLRIKNSDPLEFYVENSNIILKKHSTSTRLFEVGDILSKAIASNLGANAIITDNDEIIFAYGKDSKNLVGKKLSDDLLKVIMSRAPLLKNDGVGKTIEITDESQGVKSAYALPIISNGDANGLVAVFFTSENSRIGAEHKLSVDIACEFLGSLLE
ncbi:MAG: stage V sporulation T C-terminal domain-containing protein [Clostridia bacterium]